MVPASLRFESHVIREAGKGSGMSSIVLQEPSLITPN
jgi:hypothetical protein